MELPCSSSIRDPENLDFLHNHLKHKSYIAGGAEPSQNDALLFLALGNREPNDTYKHLLRWYRHISSFGKDIHNFPKPSKMAILLPSPPNKENNEVCKIVYFGC